MTFISPCLIVLVSWFGILVLKATVPGMFLLAWAFGFRCAGCFVLWINPFLSDAATRFPNDQPCCLFKIFWIFPDGPTIYKQRSAASLLGLSVGHALRRSHSKRVPAWTREIAPVVLVHQLCGRTGRSAQNFQFSSANKRISKRDDHFSLPSEGRCNTGNLRRRAPHVVASLEVSFPGLLRVTGELFASGFYCVSSSCRTMVLFLFLFL